MTIIRFPIASPRDLLSKAKREIDALDTEIHGLEPDHIAIADLTINAGWSLWHVTDWIGNNTDPAVSRVVPDFIKKTGEERTYAFQKQLRSESDELEICWAVSLRFKHLVLERDSRANDVLDAPEYLSAAVAPPMPADFSAEAQTSVARGFPSSALHPKVNAGGERRRLLEVYRKAYEYLDGRLKKHGL
jgi:hypothetical protein